MLRPEERSPKLVSSGHEPEAQEDLKPFGDTTPPTRALDDAMRQLTQEQWDIKCSGLNSLRRLAFYHADVMTSSLDVDELITVLQVAEETERERRMLQLQMCEVQNY